MRRIALSPAVRRLLCAVAMALLAVTPAGTRALAADAAAASAHAFTFDGLDGAPLRLADHAGGPLLVVNTASLCGYTYQYEGLQALYQRYKDRGLTVVGVPSGDFAGQEHDSAEEIRDVCQGIYAVTFPLAMKSPVRGADAHPFYRWARAAFGPENVPGWNFHKYLIAPDGSPVAAFPTRVEPLSDKLTAAIERLLPAPG